MAATSLAYSRHESNGNRSGSAAVPRILLIEDVVGTSNTFRDQLSQSYSVTTCTRVAATRFLGAALPYDLVIIDSLPGSLALNTLAAVKSCVPFTPVIMLCAMNDTRFVARAMRMGAGDCLLTPVAPTELEEALRECMIIPKGITPSSPLLREQEVPLADNNSFVFASEKMWDIRAQCALVARVDLPVLILGESGTGKEVLAQFIHKTSPRANRTFLKVNCAAMPADLLESELFGYEQGAFTGASRSKPGKFELCNHGTILLDEIGEMPAEMQAKLLQVLQDGTFARLGSRTNLKVDVRVIAATNIDIRSAIAQKKFREDLYYRLNGFNITLPPLRERREEISVLFRYFMRKFDGKYNREPLTPSDALLEAVSKHAWPGNLRELENFVRRYLVLGNEELMLSELGTHVGPTIKAVVDHSTSSTGGLKKLVRGVKGEAEMQAISEALQNSGWNRKLAAFELKISYKALLYKVRQYGIRFPDGY